ncbi:unnamed protein product, partial [Polarella glacialis]
MAPHGHSLPPHVPGECQGLLRAELLGFEPIRDELPRGGQVMGVLNWWGQDPTESAALPRLQLHSADAIGSFPPLEGVRGAILEGLDFPIQCSPERFTSYLRDMQVLFVRLLLQEPLAGSAATKASSARSGAAPGLNKARSEALGVCEVTVLPWLAGHTLRLE